MTRRRAGKSLCFRDDVWVRRGTALALVVVMQTRRERFRALGRGDSGQDLIEYAMLLGLIALSCTVLLPDLGRHVRSTYGRAASALQKSTDRPMMVRAGAGPIVVTEHRPSDDRDDSRAHQRR